MDECPVCGQKTADRDCLADHMIRAHWNLPLGYPPRKMESASYKGHGFAGFYCWCGDPITVMITDDGKEAFLKHCDEKGGIDAHLLALMLGVNEP